MSKKKGLFEENDDEVTNETQLSINNDYANNYTTWRQKEELQKCALFFVTYLYYNFSFFSVKDRYGNDADVANESSDDSGSSEDDDGQVCNFNFLFKVLFYFHRLGMDGRT
jgi:hypothetical protein